jgi:hypothetical protein
MDAARARAVLGVHAGASSAEVRDAYRAAMRATHPDVAGPTGTRRAAALNDAYAALRAAHDRPTPAPTPAAHRTAPPPPSVPVEVLDGDTIWLDAPPDEAFARLLEACSEVGEVTYVDRSCPILEAMVAVPGEGACSLVITLQGRAHGTEAFCTLESIERVAQPPVTPLVRALAHALVTALGT